MDRRGAVLGTLVQRRRDARMDGGSRRRLVAILFADIVGYSRMMAEDETATVAAVRTLRREVIEPRVIGRGGRPFATLGDGFVAEFPSAVEAVACAVEVQRGLAAIGPGRLRGVALRIAVNLGDMVVDPGGDMFGDAVNVAARLEALAEPGGVVISGKTYEEIRGRLAYPFADAGEHSLKNIPLPVRVFSLPAAIIAALPEPAPGSGTRESSDAGAAPRRRRRIIALLAAGAALVAVAGMAGQPATAPKPVSVAPASTAPAPAPRLPLVIPPFADLGQDAERDRLADGITEDLTTMLGYTYGAVIISCGTAFTYKGRAVDMRQVGRELAVRHVVQGSVRRLGDRVVQR